MEPLKNTENLQEALKSAVALSEEQPRYLFNPDDRVVKDTGDYVYEGNIVARFKKKTSNLTRYVVQDDRGLLFIFSEGQLKLK